MNGESAPRLGSFAQREAWQTQPRLSRKVIMFIPELKRHVSVSSIPELEHSLHQDSGFWNVVSIREPWLPRPRFLQHGKRVHEALFEDREANEIEANCRPAREEDIAGIFKFIDEHPGEPVLVHCLAGVSRSPAIALALIVRGLVVGKGRKWARGKVVDVAVGRLLQIRGQAIPNMLVLRLSLGHLLENQEAETFLHELENHAELRRNRYAM